MFRRNCENSLKMILNFIVIQKRFWKDNIENVKNNNMTNFRTTNLFVSQLSSVSSLKNLHIFFWTKLVFKEFSIMLIFTFSMSSFQNRFCITIKFSIIFQNLHSFFWTQLVFKESSIMLIFTFSISSFQNHFYIMIKFSIIF